MAKMNWSYIAGFFDGEGCVHVKVGGPGRARMPFSLSMAQTAKHNGKELFSEMADFLSHDGITPRVFLRKKQYEHNDFSYAMVIYRVSDVVMFLTKCLPWLRVKRTIAQDALRYRKMFPSPRQICIHLGQHDRGQCVECRKRTRREWARKDRANNPQRYEEINARRREARSAI